MVSKYRDILEPPAAAPPPVPHHQTGAKSRGVERDRRSEYHHSGISSFTPGTLTSLDVDLPSTVVTTEPTARRTTVAPRKPDESLGELAFFGFDKKHVAGFKMLPLDVPYVSFFKRHFPIVGPPQVALLLEHLENEKKLQGTNESKDEQLKDATLRRISLPAPTVTDKLHLEANRRLSHEVEKDATRDQRILLPAWGLRNQSRVVAMPERACAFVDSRPVRLKGLER
jgi:hypothetical protein